MEYHEAANFLFDLRRFRPKPGTESTADLLDHFGNPHEGVTYVQVAGSNGKGSTARMVERVLREAGLSVGLYTSPHLEDLRERVRVDGRKIPRSAVASFVEDCREYVTDRAADGNSPTFFETMTAMACWQFGRQDVDVAVLEVGIGGKYDATSVVDPVASAVTSVTLEHTGIIGDTIEEIARDKAHVAGERPLVTGATGETLDAIRDVAGDVVTVGRAGTDDASASDAGAPDSHEESGAAPDVRVEYGGRTNHAEAAVSIAGPDWEVETRLSMLGAHQAENAGIAAVLARQAGAVTATEITTADLVRGLRNAHWPGRFEVVRREPLVVLDGAHNPGACERLAETLETFEYDDLHLVVGAMHDKDHAAMAEALPTPDAVTACRPRLDRAEDGDVIAAVFERAGAGTITTESAVLDALASALADAGPDDCVLVTGSLFVVAEARSRYSRAGIPKRIRDLDDARAALEGAGVTAKGVWRMRGKAVHRVVKLSVQERQAAYLKQELLSVGGECSLSGLQRDEAPVEAVCMGTLAQFKRLIEKLEAQPYGLAEVGEELRQVLGIGVGGRRGGPPAASSADDSGRIAGSDDSGATAAEPADTGDSDAPNRSDTGGSGASAGSDDTDASATRYPWQDGTAVMGILNVTPDSFHDGGEYDAVDDAVARAEEMASAGADLVDVGGESTRPGADPVSVEEEIDRVVPVVERLADRDLDALISVDTRKAAVAEAALEAGADVLNDVSGLEDPEMRFVAAEHDAPLVVMHSIDAPVVPGRDVPYDDVVENVIESLGETVLLAEKAGLDREQIVVDPGIGFGKSPAESFELLDRLGELRALGCPILFGHSHKSLFEVVDRGPDERGAATVAASALAADRGADVVRVHDVSENVAAVKTALAARDARGSSRDGDSGTE